MNTAAIAQVFHPEREADMSMPPGAAPAASTQCVQTAQADQPSRPQQNPRFGQVAQVQPQQEVATDQLSQSQQDMNPAQTPSGLPLVQPSHVIHATSTAQRRNRISLKVITEVAEADVKKIKNEILEPVALTPEALERFWKKLTSETPADTPLGELIITQRAVYNDAATFSIITTDPTFKQRFEPYKAEVERIMQSAAYTNNPAIHCEVVLTKATQRTAYEPEEKYDQMLKENPAMSALRHIFPDLELG